MVMDDWPDEKIRSTSLRYINKAVMNESAWRATSLGEIHPKLTMLVDLQSGELPILSCFHSALNWYVLSTRRVLGICSENTVDVAVLDIVEPSFGNFKSVAPSTSELMRLRLGNGRVVELEYETGAASMAPIYYFQYWAVKYPILPKLKI
jgi:hypothetical protein